jgi:hypothetical protein
LRSLRALAVLALTLASGCGGDDTGGRPPAMTGANGAAQPAATDQWLGQWTGPEGTFLRITGGQARYEITIQNLDGPRTFKGTASGDRIQFERDGIAEVIRATDGAGTGMKWLSEKSDCLTVRPGEGYCRK